MHWWWWLAILGAGLGVALMFLFPESRATRDGIGQALDRADERGHRN